MCGGGKRKIPGAWRHALVGQERGLLNRHGCPGVQVTISSERMLMITFCGLDIACI